ncbi:DDE-type integrase/transposase/recombinase [Candidatus Woesearchaeota archaeon]|nr:DDE-type integrase/transposase/recombinase [Candidatus Woesearchaeota archaeon]
MFLKEKHKKAKDRRLMTFVCDGYWPYRLAFNKLFYGVAKLVFGVPIANKKHGVKHNNNPIERYNQNLDDRIKVMRNFKSFSCAKSFFDLHRICRNFINPCMQLKGKTPAEAAEIKLPLGRNKLLALIRHMAKQKHHSSR